MAANTTDLVKKCSKQLLASIKREWTSIRQRVGKNLDALLTVERSVKWSPMKQLSIDRDNEERRTSARGSVHRWRGAKGVGGGEGVTGGTEEGKGNLMNDAVPHAPSLTICWCVTV